MEQKWGRRMVDQMEPLRVEKMVDQMEMMMVEKLVVEWGHQLEHQSGHQLEHQSGHQLEHLSEQQNPLHFLESKELQLQ
jgi:ribosomal protein L5